MMKAQVLFCVLLVSVMTEQALAQTTQPPAPTTTQGIVKDLVTIRDIVACIFGICPSTQPTPAATVKTVPTTVKAIPTTVKAVPTTVAPTTVKAVPTTVGPTTVKAAPTTVKAVPTTVTPATVKAAPTTVKAVPTTVAPTTVKAVPTTVAPTTVKAAPTTVKSVPTTPKAVTTTARPTTMKPRGLVQEPVFIESNDTAVEILATAFDCRRTGHDCDPTGGMCDLDTGACTCSENYTGFACHILADSLLNVTMCNDGNGCGDNEDAVCVNQDISVVTQPNSLPTCDCPYSVFGKACEKPRFELRCSSDFLTIHVTPYNTISSVYVIDHEKQTKIDNPACVFKGKDPQTLQVLYTDVVAKCRGIAPDNATTELRFVVQSDADWLTSFDQVVTARCTLKVSQEFQKTIIVEAGIGAGIGPGVPGGPLVASQVRGTHISNDLTNVGANEIAAERQRIDYVTITPHPYISLGQEVISEDETTNIVPINGTVKVGDVVIFTIENLNEPFFAALRAEECTMKMDESMSMNLIKNQCPATRLAWSLLEWKKTKATNSTVSYYLRLPANALAGQPRQITITCRVKLCAEDVVDECALPEDECQDALQQLLAPRGGNSPRRSRRSAESTAYAYVKKTFDLDYEETAPKKTRLGSAGSSASSIQLSAGVVAFSLAKWLML